MPTPKKEQALQQIEEWLSRATVVLVTDYRGLTVAQMSELRRKLQREAGSDYHVVKNTLAQRAAEKLGKTNFSELLRGPSALVLGYGEDVVQPAKVLLDHIRTTRSIMTVRGGLLNHQLLTPGQISSLATLPPKPVLVGQVIGGLQAPLARLVQVLSAPIGSLAQVLQARQKQLEAPS